MADPSPGNVNGGRSPIVGTEGYPRYPAYKDSGIEWLGEIPAHWEVKRTRHAARLESGHTPSRKNSEYWQDCSIPWFTLADVWQIREGGRDVVTETKEQISELGLAHSAARLLPKGTVILSRTASVGFSAIAGVDMATTQDYVNWVCTSDLHPDYLLLVFRSMNSEFQRYTMGSTHRTIYMPDVRSFSTPLPPIEEQTQVVMFVCVETARIDALVAKKKRLIELLLEKRTTLITRAVTKGIDPDVPMKNSGVEWLGEIQVHWNVKQLRWAITFQRGHDLPSDDREEGDVPIVSSSGISSRHSRAAAVAPGIVTGRYGTIGQFHLMNQPYWPLNTTLYSINLHGNEPRFLRYMLMHMRPLFLLHAVKSAVPGVDRNDIHADHTALPNWTEQHKIADHLDRETAKIDALAAKIREAIERLKELRTALISAAVTGKIDVREAAG